MDLLFRREQTQNSRGAVVFRLWAKAELNEDEQALVDRYRLHGSRVVLGDDTAPFKWAVRIGLIVFALATALLMMFTYGQYMSFAGGVIAGLVAGSWWFNEKRETIYLRDLIHGRRFKCASIVELVQKEAMLQNITTVVRQVLETAKHWEGVETLPVPVLQPEEAKDLVAKLS